MVSFGGGTSSPAAQPSLLLASPEAGCRVSSAGSRAGLFLKQLSKLRLCFQEEQEGAEQVVLLSVQTRCSCTDTLSQPDPFP